MSLCVTQSSAISPSQTKTLKIEKNVVLGFTVTKIETFCSLGYIVML